VSHATLAQGASDGELRTGDLGYIANGQLHIVDRLKDLIVIAGGKYSPADVEGIVGRVDGIRSGTVIAFSSRGGAGTEDLYVVAGVQPHRGRATTRSRSINPPHA
jgi:fatty-acyl-CoA synthase